MKLLRIISIIAALAALSACGKIHTGHAGVRTAWNGKVDTSLESEGFYTAVTSHVDEFSAKEIANAAAGGQAIGIQAEGRLMDAGTMTVQMRIPVAPSTLAFQYSGKLSAMDLTRLDGYMDGSGRIQIRSGSASEASFDIDVVGGHAHGALRGVYRDLHVTVVDRDTGSEKGVTNRVATILTNQLKVRNENTPDKSGALKAGKVDYARKPEETFLQFAWLALRTGVLDLISLQASPIP